MLLTPLLNAFCLARQKQNQKKRKRKGREKKRNRLLFLQCSQQRKKKQQRSPCKIHHASSLLYIYIYIYNNHECYESKFWCVDSRGGTRGEKMSESLVRSAPPRRFAIKQSRVLPPLPPNMRAPPPLVYSFASVNGVGANRDALTMGSCPDGVTRWCDQ